MQVARLCPLLSSCLPQHISEVHEGDLSFVHSTSDSMILRTTTYGNSAWCLLFQYFFPAGMDSLTTYFGGLLYRFFFMLAQQARNLLVCLGFVTTTWENYFEEYFGQCLPEKLYKLAKGI